MMHYEQIVKAWSESTARLPTQRVKFIDNFLVLMCNMKYMMVDNKKHNTSKFLRHFILLKLSPTVLITITLFAPFSTCEIDANI